MADQFQKALASVPRERAGELAVPTSQATGAELKNVLTALENPPPTADVGAMLASVVTSLTLLVRTVQACTSAGYVFSLLDAGIMVVAAAGFFMPVYRYVDQKTKKHPFHDDAKMQVQALIDFANPAQHSTPQTTPKDDGS